MPVGYTGSLWVTGSVYVNGQELNTISASYAITSSYGPNDMISASNALTKTGSVVELGGFMYKNTYITGTLEDTVDYSFTQSGSAVTTGSSIASLTSLEKDSSGRIYVSSFNATAYKGVTVGRSLFRIYEDGTLDTSFNTGAGFILSSSPASGQVRCVRVDPITGKIYAAGRFDTYSGSSVGFGIVRLNPDGTLDTSFNTGVGFTGTNNGSGPWAFSIDLDSNGKIVVGGAWTGYSGSSVGWSICRLNTDGTYDTSFNVGNGVSVYGSAVGTSVYHVKVEPGTNKVYFTGQFNNYSGSVGYKGILKLNSDGTIDQTFNAKPGLDTYQLLSSPYPAGWTTSNGSDNIIIDSNLNVYLVGFFKSFNTTGSDGIIKITSSGSIDTSFNYGSGFFSYGNQYTSNGIGFNVSLAYLDEYNRLYYFGFAKTYSGSTINGSARILPNGNLDTTFKGNDGTGSYIDYVVSQDKKSIYLAGSFYLLSGGGYGGKATDSRFIKVNIADPELKFTKTSLAYDADYSQFYTTRSMVDKGYVDNRLTGSLYLTGSVTVTGSLSATSYVAFSTYDPLPTSNVATASIASSGSGTDNKPYYWNGSAWTPLF